jgi:hypothetical protein
MEKVMPQSRPPISSLICFAFGHDYIVTRKITNHVFEYECACCGREVSNNRSGKFEKLTLQKRKLNEKLSRFFIKKRKLKFK